MNLLAFLLGVITGWAGAFALIAWSRKPAVLDRDALPVETV